jgi:hypothetical protein
MNVRITENNNPENNSSENVITESTGLILKIAQPNGIIY